jgi:preprotein translocase YajC subunit
MLDGATSPLLQIVPFVLILGIFYFIILLPTKRKQQKVQEFLDNLKVNDRIITTGGIYGQITRLGDQSVQLQIATKSGSRSPGRPLAASRASHRSSSRRIINNSK